MKEVNGFLEDLNFDDMKINKRIHEVKIELKKYIEEKILP